MGALLGIVVIAYSYSLTTLLQIADLNTPLAYVSLVPADRLDAGGRPQPTAQPEPAIHDRQTDYIIGIPLMVAALMRQPLSSRQVVRHVLGVADRPAHAAVLRGRRRRRHLRGAGAVAPEGRHRVPPPGLAVSLHTVLLRVLDASTSTTLFGIAQVVHVMHVATPVASGRQRRLLGSAQRARLRLSVVSACSGMNSIVGFLLVGVAFAAVVRGPLGAQDSVAGRGHGPVLGHQPRAAHPHLLGGPAEGEDFAIDVLHPYIGLVTFSLGVVDHDPVHQAAGTSSGTTAEFGRCKRPRRRSPSGRATGTSTFGGAEGVSGSGDRPGARDPRRVQQRRPAVLQPRGQRGGETEADSYIDRSRAPVGWTSRYETTYTWAEPLFGEGSIWNRYELYSRHRGRSAGPDRGGR